MYKGKKIIITICARGGSKGVPGKNIRKLAGKPLLAHSIQAAKDSGIADRIMVSTDDEEIRKVAVKNGIEVPFLRPKKLADSKTSREEVIAYATEQAQKYWGEDYDIIVDIGNATPFTNGKDVRAVVKLLVDSPHTDVAFTVTPAARNPYFNMVEVDNKGYAHVSKKPATYVSRRQDTPPVYDMNDGAYAMWKDTYLKARTVRQERVRVYVMPPERSVDIDREIDFKIAELLMKDMKK
jgi:CMP-N,N'-diacetyllegionaminic acid synthase